MSLGKNSTGLITYLFENFWKIGTAKKKNNKNLSNDNWIFSKFDENTKAKSKYIPLKDKDWLSSRKEKIPEERKNMK